VITGSTDLCITALEIHLSKIPLLILKMPVILGTSVDLVVIRLCVNISLILLIHRGLLLVLLLFLSHWIGIQPCFIPVEVGFWFWLRTILLYLTPLWQGVADVMNQS